MNTPRRSLLAAIVTLPALPSSAEISADPAISAEQTFMRWLGMVGYMNGPRVENLRDDDLRWDAVDAAEAAISSAPPTPMKAVALCLHELTYALSEVGLDATIRSIMRTEPENPRFPIRLLECLRPIATGQLAVLAADLLDHPDRPFCQAALCRAYSGELLA